jgi:hypothetical protein
LDQVRGRGGVGAAASPAAAGVHPDQLLGAHQPGDPLAATAPPEASQLGMHPWCAVGAPRPLVDLHDHPGELSVAHRPRRRRPAEPGVEPRSRDSQDPTEPLDAVDVSLLGDEPEAADRIVSWAK